MDDPYDVFGDPEKNDHLVLQHPSRTPDTEADVVMSPRRVSRSRTRLHQSYSKRQNLIKRGRALIQRGRESKQEQAADVSVMSSFSIDDGSYKDDLRRSILEEEKSRRRAKSRSTCREGNYRKLKCELEQSEKTVRTTLSTRCGDKDRTTATSLGYPPVHEKTEGAMTHTIADSVLHTVSSNANVVHHNVAHSTMQRNDTAVSTRIRNWEQVNTSSSPTDDGKQTKLDDISDQQSEALDVRQHTEERVLYLKQWLKDRDEKNAMAKIDIVKDSAEETIEQDEAPPIIQRETLRSTPKQPTTTATTTRVSPKEKKLISAVVRQPEAAVTLGISSGFPFPQDANITIGTSCSISELTTTALSKKEQKKTESDPIPTELTSTSPDPKKPMTAERVKSNSLEVSKSLDDVNQMLPERRVSRPPTEQQHCDKESSPKPTSTISSEERGYISSSQRQRKAEPLLSLLDFDSQEDSSIDRPAVNLLETDDKMSHPLDEHQISKDIMPAVDRTYSKMSNLPSQNSSSNSDGIRTIARESQVSPPSDARSIACPDNDSNASPEESKPASKGLQAIDHRAPPHSPSSSFTKTEKREIDADLPTELDVQVEGHTAPVKTILSISKTENNVHAEMEPPERDEVILEVASSLTDSMQGGKPSPSRATSKILRIPEGNKSKPSLRRSRRALINPDGDDSVDMSVSYKEGASFDSKESVTETDERIWRMDPLDSLSDFILQIRDKGTGKGNLYHVHKHKLACGPRKSSHLDSLFKERSTSSAHFFFCSKSCDVFPSVLDFMYCDDTELKFTTTNVVIYRWIGYELKIKSLVAATTRFILEDMQVSNMTSYVSDMEVHGHLGMRKIMSEKCASKIEHISELDSLWILMDPELFQDTVSCQVIDRAKTSQHLSILIAEYTTLHKHEMTKAMLGNLTSSAILPKIAREAALPLLEICFSYGSPVEFEGLQKRCALTMATYWKITNENDRQRLFALLRNLPSSFIVDFLEKVDTGKMTFLLGQEYQNDETDGEMAKANEIEKDDTFSMGEGDTDFMGWKLDPDVSYSDWVIRVKSGTNSCADAYYVHKPILAVGKHKSTFFTSVFSSNRNQSITRGSTSVSLDQDAAQMFPRMLDFIYSKGKVLDISTENVVPLRFLARTFQVYALNRKTIEFVQRDLCEANVPQYLENADSFNDKGITAMVIEFVAANIEEIDIDSELLNVLEPGIFRRIISSEAIDSAASQSYHVPMIIAKYFFIHELDESLLEDIMGTYDMEQLDCLNALKLLQIICRLEQRETSFFLTLRDKCTEVLTDSWDDFRASFRDEVFAIMLTLDTETVARIFDKVENRCYEKVEKAEEMLPAEAFAPTLEIPSPENLLTDLMEFEAQQGRNGGNVIMPPAITTPPQYMNQEQTEDLEHRQPEPEDDRLWEPLLSMASAPSEEMRARPMSSAPSAQSDEMRVSTMKSSPSKEVLASASASAPLKEVVVMPQTTAPESCQIFSCGFMATE